MNIAQKHITSKSRNSKLKEKYYINGKTHLATEKKFVLHHSVKINKQGGLNKLWGVGKKFEELISIPPLFIRHLRVILEFFQVMSEPQNLIIFRFSCYCLAISTPVYCLGNTYTVFVCVFSFLVI